MTNRIRIAIIDDHPMFRTGLIASLRRFADIEVVSVGASAADAVRAANGPIDILLLDIGIPGGGLEAGRRIVREHPAVKIIYLTGSNREADATEAIAAGARGYVLKGATGRELAKAIRSVSSGTAYFAPELALRMLTGRRSHETEPGPPPSPPRCELPELSPREQQVLDLAARGLKNHEIAEELGLSVAGIKYHFGQIVRRWGVRNRVEAIAVHSQRRG